MEKTNWPCIDWEEVWSSMRKARIRPLKITDDKDFKRDFMADAFARARANDYEYGRKAVESLAGLLRPDFEVLEIGAGPGTLSIPLAEKVKIVRAMEISPKMATALGREMEDKEIHNVEVIKSDWMRVAESEMKAKCDLVVCSHFLWQVKDLELHLEKMENASRKFCAIIQPSGRDAVVREAYEAVTSRTYEGQFEPDADLFPYIILRQKGRIVNTGYFEYAIKRDQPELVRYVTSFVGKYIEVDKKIGEGIRDFVTKYIRNGFHIEQCKAVVMWWRVM